MSAMSTNIWSKEHLLKFSLNTLLIYLKSDGTSSVFSYEDVLLKADQVKSVILQFCGCSGKTIAISCCNEEYLIVPMILGTIHSGNTFSCLPKDSDEKTIDDFIRNAGPDFIISNTQISSDLLALQGTVDVFYVNKVVASVKTNLSNFLYIIQTSGSTGNPKIVRVPEECILSNVKQLKEVFRIDENDRILCCSPPTFDPFLVDLFLAISSGSALVFVENFPVNFCSKIHQIFNGKLKTGATFCQITPSVFKTIPYQDQEYLFSERSSLKTIAFGGEPFPIREISMLNSSFKYIYNLYGITEISSWSSIEKFSNQQVMGLGISIDDEVFELRENNELWIGSKTRKCFIDDHDNSDFFSNKVLYRRTGDIVEIDQDKNMIFKGRLDNIVKRYGIKVNLSNIESVLMKSNLNITSISCIFEQIDRKILVFYVANENITSNLFKYAYQNLAVGEKPDVIIRIPKFPVTSHGKISKSELLDYYHKTYKNSFKIEDKIKHIFKNYNLNLSFLQNGGDSVQALRILSEIEFIINKPLPNLLPQLLNYEIPLNTVILNNFQDLDNPKEMITQKSNLKLKYNLEITWKVDMGKCIDADPVIFNYDSKDLIGIASHSHQVFVINPDTGIVNNSLVLPDRIESPVSVEDSSIFTGCYDGFLYKFNLKSTEIQWKFDSGGMIKCQPLVLEHFVIFGNYSSLDNLFCLNSKTGSKVWSTRVGTKGILSSPLLIADQIVLICTLDGTIKLLNSETGSSLKNIKLENPVFASPTLVKSKVLVPEVTGQIHCLASQSLEYIWTFPLSGNVFSSVEVDSLSSDSTLLWIGCHDNNLYCLKSNLNNERSSVELILKICLESQIYCSPRLFYFNNEPLIVACTTVGSVFIVNRDSGEIRSTISMPGEIFSRPVSWNNSVLFGCRDNNFYCLKLAEAN